MKNTCVVDLGYGDSGKGALVSRLCAEGDVAGVVRFNGGCQAAHNVITDDGRHHTFAQFGAGTFQGVPTFLSKHILVEPLSLVIEAEALKKVGIEYPYHFMHIDPEAIVTTPYHWLLNRWQEDQRGKGRHGSTGRGIGCTVEHSLEHPDDALRYKDIWDIPVLNDKLAKIREWADAKSNHEGMPSTWMITQDYENFRTQMVRPEHTFTWQEFASMGRMVFEGAQGVLLDEHVGFHPHTTWSTVTPDNAHTLHHESGSSLDFEVMGVVRAYTTRHGAGPFVPEDNTLDLPEAHNKRERYQEHWRVGHFDAPAVKYALDACMGVDSLYVTHTDSAKREPRLHVCTGYELDDEPFDLVALDPRDKAARELQTEALKHCTPVLEKKPQLSWADSISDLLGVPLAGLGMGPSVSDGLFLERLVFS